MKVKAALEERGAAETGPLQRLLIGWAIRTGRA